MSINAMALEGRSKGKFDVSIGTSLALEAFFDIFEPGENGVKPDNGPEPYKHYDEVWINVRTLFRNIHGAIKREHETTLSAVEYADAMLQEMLIIQGHFEKQDGGRVQPFFYYCTYKTLNKRYMHAQFKQPETPNQKFYAALENTSLQALMEKVKDMGLVKGFDISIFCNRKRVCMLTNFPVDLLNTTNYHELALLESHTGRIKKRAKWYTKLKNGKDLTNIPFDRMTIQLFGDSGDMFKPFPPQVKKTMLEIATDRHWTPLTTKDKIMQSLQLAHEPILQGLVRNLYA